MIEKTGNDLLVIASHPQELAEAQTALVVRVKGMEAEAQVDLNEAVILIDRCQKAHLGTNRPKRFKRLAESRLLYLSKMREALEAGYVIVPNFPGETIAIRVKRDDPKHQSKVSTYNYPALDDAKSEELPASEGRYVDPAPFVKKNDSNTKDSNGMEITKFYSRTDGFNEELSLPVEFLKPTIVELTGSAMTRKLFDEIAITKDSTIRDGDPMVLGRIRDRRNKKLMSFLIAWFVDTKTF